MNTLDKIVFLKEKDLIDQMEYNIFKNKIENKLLTEDQTMENIENFYIYIIRSNKKVFEFIQNHQDNISKNILEDTKQLIKIIFNTDIETWFNVVDKLPKLIKQIELDNFHCSDYLFISNLYNIGMYGRELFSNNINQEMIIKYRDELASGLSSLKYALTRNRINLRTNKEILDILTKLAQYNQYTKRVEVYWEVFNDIKIDF